MATIDQEEVDRIFEARHRELRRLNHEVDATHVDAVVLAVGLDAIHLVLARRDRRVPIALLGEEDRRVARTRLQRAAVWRDQRLRVVEDFGGDAPVCSTRTVDLAGSVFRHVALRTVGRVRELVGDEGLEPPTSSL